MNSKSIVISFTSVLGAIAGIAVAWWILFYLRGADYEVVKEYFHSYLFLGGLNYKKVIFLVGSAIAGAAALTLLTLIVFAQSSSRHLKELYSDFNFDTKYIVAQRGRETWMIGLFFIGIAIAVLYLFLLIHNPESNDGKIDFGSFGGGRGVVSPLYPFLKLGMTMVVVIACVVAGLIAIYGALKYGRFKRLPIEVVDDSISFFQTFSRLPILAIDRPVTVELDDAEIDFDASSKGSLTVVNDGLRVAVSPKLEFINGSFDELADYIEKFAIEDED